VKRPHNHAAVAWMTAQYSRFAQGIRDPIDLFVEHDADLIQLRLLKPSE